MKCYIFVSWATNYWPKRYILRQNILRMVLFIWYVIGNLHPFFSIYQLNQNSYIGPSAVPITQMSQLPESTEGTCIEKEPKIRALPGKHGKFLHSPSRAESQIRDITSSISNNSSIATTSIVRSGKIDESSGFLTIPPQYSSLHQTKRQMRTQNAFVSSSSNSVSNNCDSKNLNDITTTVTSHTGEPAKIESVEGEY